MRELLEEEGFFLIREERLWTGDRCYYRFLATHNGFPVYLSVQIDHLDIPVSKRSVRHALRNWRRKNGR